MDAASPTSPPGGILLERERELAILREVVAGVAKGRPGLVAIEGPAGIGKSRLLAEGRRLGEDAGARVLVNRDIAEALFVTPKTVERHLSSAYRKPG